MSFQSWCFFLHCDELRVWQYGSCRSLHQRKSSIFVSLSLSLCFALKDSSRSESYTRHVVTLRFLNAVEIVNQGSTHFRHESVSGFYRVSVYFIGKLLCDVLPMRAVPIFIFSVITYWMIGASRSICGSEGTRTRKFSLRVGGNMPPSIKSQESLVRSPSGPQTRPKFQYEMPPGVTLQ